MNVSMKIVIPSHLSDAHLVAALHSLARDEREATAQLVAHLAEMDARRLFLRAGFSSLFVYCTTALCLSEDAAYNRIEVARTVRRFPVILDKLAEGSLSIATVRLISPHLTPENKEALIGAASGKSKRQVEELLARHAPRPDVAPSMRKLPTPASAPPMAGGGRPGATPATAPRPQTVPALAAAAVAIPGRRPLVAPLSPGRYEVRFTASAETCEKLRLAQDLLRHALPTGDPAEIIDRALTLLLADLARKKFAATDRPRASRSTRPESRSMPAKVRRAMGLRDEGRCAFIGEGGRRCNERAFLEFHHLKPYGVGGQATVANIALRCRAHNQYEADLFYGRRMESRQTGPDG